MFILAKSIPLAPTSPRVLATLLSILLLSAAVFATLVRRWTSERYRFALSDWARERGFRLKRSCETPEPLNTEIKAALSAAICLSSRATSLFALEQLDSGGTTARWHVLVREIQSPWPATGLRPARAPASLLDLFSLSSYPTMGNPERYIVSGTESLAARRLSQSHARGLLPPDIGLLLVGRRLMLDFSARPFDPIEFDRMTALAEQLVAHLPRGR